MDRLFPDEELKEYKREQVKNTTSAFRKNLQSRCKSPDEIKDSIKHIAYPHKQFYRWTCCVCGNISNDPAIRFEDKSSIYNNITQDLFSSKYSESSNKFNLQSDDGINDLINNLNVNENAKGTLWNHPHSTDFVYNLALLNQYSDIIGEKRLSTWIKHGKNINDIMTYCTGSFEDLLSNKEIQDFENAKSKGQKIHTPEKIQSMYSKLLWLEKIHRIKEQIHMITHKKDGNLKKATYLYNFMESNKKGVTTISFNVQKQPPKKGFIKTLNEGQKYCYICIDDKNCDKKHLKDETEKAKRNGYTPYICTPELYKQNDKNNSQDFKPINPKDFDCNTLVISNLQANFNKITEKIFKNHYKLKEKVLPK